MTRNDDEEKTLADLVSEYLDKLISGENLSAETFASRHEGQGQELLQLLTYLELFRKEARLPELDESRGDSIWRNVRNRLAHDSSSNLKVDKRPDFLILLLFFADQIWGNTKLEKLVFLLAKEGGCGQFIPDFYDHYAYNFGAFDKQVPQDVEALVRSKIIRRSLPPGALNDPSEDLGIPTKKRVDSVYQLTDKGRQLAKQLVSAAQRQNPQILQSVRTVLARHGRKNAHELIDYTYKKYPEYAKNSFVRDQYLPPEDDDESDAKGDLCDPQ